MAQNDSRPINVVLNELDARVSAAEAAVSKPTLTALTLAASSVTENAASGTVVGGILGKTSGSTLSLFNDDGGRFAISGTNLVAGLTNIDYEAATSRSIVLRETLAGATNSPRDTSLAVGVVNVFEQPSLRALLLSTTNLTIGAAASGAITEAATGSAITASGLPAGYTINGPARTWAYDGSGPALNSTVTLTETLGDSPNSPRVTQVGISVTEQSTALSSFAVTPPADYGPSRDVPFADTGTPQHQIGFIWKAGMGDFRVGFHMKDANNGKFFRNLSDATYQLGTMTNGNYDADSGWANEPWLYQPLTDLDITLRVGDDGLAALYQGVNRLTRLYDVGASASTGVAFKVTYANDGYFPRVSYGSNAPVIYAKNPAYDAFSRKLTLPITYTNINQTGTVPDYAELQYGAGGSWLPMRTESNAKPGVAVLSATIPASVVGTTDVSIRWHNLPSYAQTMQIVVATPFERRLGVNGGGLSTDLTGGWEIICANEQFVSPYTDYGNGTGSAILRWGEFESGKRVPISLDGLNGTVQRDRYGGIGRNSVGILEYQFRNLVEVTSQINAYIDWLPGVKVRSKYGQGYPHDFAHNETTGRSTFTLKPGGANQCEFVVTVSSIPAGQTVRGIIKDLAAPAQSTFVSTYGPVSKGLRFLDSGGYNNTGDKSATPTKMAVRTLANRPLTQTFEEQAASLVATSSKFAYGIFGTIDGPDMVAGHADYWAANLPDVTYVCFGTSNEVFNGIFKQFADYQIEGVRSGFAAAGSTPANAVPETIIDSNSNGVPEFVINVNSDGTKNDTGSHLKLLGGATAGQKFYRNISGGVQVYQFLTDTPAGFVWAKYTDNANVKLLYTSNAVVSAGKRSHSDFTVRNGEIAKARYAAAGKPAPDTVLEGFAADFNWSVEGLNWNNNYLKIDRVSFAPYFNNSTNSFMNWNNVKIWTADAKAKIMAADYAGALAIVLPAIKTESIDKDIQAMQNWTGNLRAYNVSKGLAPDKIKPIIYEFGDHTGFSGYNWPNGADPQAFIRYFWTDVASYEVFLRYLTGIASLGCPAMLYAMGPGNRPFGLVKNDADTVLTGPGANHYYRAMKEIQDKIAALPTN